MNETLKRLLEHELEPAAGGRASADGVRRPAEELPGHIHTQHVLLLLHIGNRGYHILGEDSRGQQVRPHRPGARVLEESQTLQHNRLQHRLMLHHTLLLLVDS